ncbi:MAG: ectoine hydroxylase-related dioxygenase (phytanoyl-CoA dioxygenase family) [Candidatus Poriferisodalaceae bacterium]|jgi:ectoine hydroxylase-related dioxygenase (phytanoyl-CoA dioxygenase family)
MEFNPAYIESQSSPELHMYRTAVTSQEPMKSVLENNPEIYFVPPRGGDNWGSWEFKPGSYYDTTTGSKHPAWEDKVLPKPTKDIAQLRSDLVDWGYCLVEDAIAPEQVQAIRERVLDQAQGERRARIAQKTPSGQNINCCVNKGRCFEGLIAQDPEVVQGGPLVEQLLTEALGVDWICTSLISAIALKGGVPQALHQDQSDSPETKHPTLVNLLTAITDIDETTGGTLIIPGSHRVLSEAMRTGEPVGKLPPAINLEAKAGTMALVDGRLLHGTGINHTDEPRIVMLNAMQAPWKRQQENWMLSVRPDVLERASAKLLQRMGFQASTGAQTNEGHGFGARGQLDEDAGALVDFRMAADRGEYIRVGELGPNSSEEELRAPFTLRDVVAKARAGGGSAPIGIGGSTKPL